MQAASPKAQANAILKDLEVGYVKHSTGDFSGKGVIAEGRYKGLRGGSIGPLTVTDAHHDHSAKVQKRVFDAFAAMEGATVEWRTCYAGATHKLSNIEVTIRLDEKKVRVLNFYWRAFKTYTASARLDPDYATYWLVMESEDRKI